MHIAWHALLIRDITLFAPLATPLRQGVWLPPTCGAAVSPLQHWCLYSLSIMEGVCHDQAYRHVVQASSACLLSS